MSLQAGTTRSEFDPKLFSLSAYDMFFCGIRGISAVYNILLQIQTMDREEI